MTMELFDQIPLACIINKKFLCVHGGISYDLKTVILNLCSWTILEKLIGLEKYRRLGSFATWYGRIRSNRRMGIAILLSKIMMREGALTTSALSLRKHFLRRIKSYQ